MAAKIDINVDTSEVQKQLDRLQASGASMKPVLTAIGSRLTNRIKMGFRTARSPAGIPWAPLKMRSGQPLSDTGRLKNSITYKVDDDGVEIGTNLTSTWHGITHSIGRVHQFGATVRPRWAPRLVFKNQISGQTVRSMKSVIPARPFMPLNAQGDLELPTPWKESVLDALKKHFAKGT